MRKSNSISRTRRLRNNNQRRVLIKKLHHRVLFRRTQFDVTELREDFQAVC
jgi:hypothetical protein